jgi:hypothetical protein
LYHHFTVHCLSGGHPVTTPSSRLLQTADCLVALADNIITTNTQTNQQAADACCRALGLLLLKRRSSMANCLPAEMTKMNSPPITSSMTLSPERGHVMAVAF